MEKKSMQVENKLKQNTRRKLQNWTRTIQDFNFCFMFETVCMNLIEFCLCFQALPRLTNREKVVEMVDPALNGHFSKKELIQVGSELPLTTLMNPSRS